MSKQGLATWLRCRAERDPNRSAITFNGRTITYAELQRKIEQFSGFLAECGVRSGERVAYFGFNHPDFLVSLFASARLGAIFVPLNFRMEGEELAFQLEDSDATVLIAGAEHVKLVNEVSARLRVATRIIFGNAQDGWKPFEEHRSNAVASAEVDVDPDAPAAILYTSGTTGRPKGAILTHRNLWTNNVNWMLSVGYHRGYTVLTSAPLFHSGGMCVMTLPVLMAGGHIVLHADFDAGRVLVDVPRYSVTALFLVPTMMLYMTQHPSFEHTDLSSVESVVAGAAPVPKHLLETFSSRDIPVNQCWGLTEVATGATFLGTERALDKLGSCGTSGMLNDVKLIDISGNEISEVNTPGELCVRGDTVSPGYWKLPDATAEARLPGAWLRTGDVAFRDADGFYFICDRLKDMVITGGENVYPAEVESAIFTHDAVSDVAVIGASDDEWGERVVAVVVLKDGRSLDLGSLREHLGGRLARYKLPRELRIVDELPRNTTGKILKHVLRENGTAGPIETVSVSCR